METTTSILLITPPFVQWNTVYPATPMLTAYLRQQGIRAMQYDLSIELVHRMYSYQSLKRIFEKATEAPKLNSFSKKVLRDKDLYLDTIDTVMKFMCSGDTTLAHLLCGNHFFPSSIVQQDIDPDWLFGTLGTVEKARYLCTRYFESVGLLVRDCIAPHFGFSRYAESIAISASSFGPVEAEILKPHNLIDEWMLELLEEEIKAKQPEYIGFTIPFPGNLYSALKCSHYIKQQHPGIKIILGGGYVNTELRSLSDPGIFRYCDYICLDDGEVPLLSILRGKPDDQLIRTQCEREGRVVLFNGSAGEHIPYKDLPAPDYSGLQLNRYISVIDDPNPMHRLWNDGLWNKFPLAHGCYWHKCSFCDTRLDYICRYDAPPASAIVDKIEKVIEQTGSHGFHFTDEAAPPKLLKDLAQELLRRKVRISWWTNIRFEKAFTTQLCSLLAESGCIAVSGGLEVASERILKLINKGVDIEQAARAMYHLTGEGIMVHAYLMYGFPTQTAQETIDALEVVRQLFMNDLVQSAYWHLFTLTAHSAIAERPADYHVQIKDTGKGSFAHNDLQHTDSPSGHTRYTKGLKLSLFNYMQGLGFDKAVNTWFDFKTPAATHPEDFIERLLGEG